MSNKILLASLVIMVGLIGVMSWKVKSASVLGAATRGEAISLFTNPNPLRTGQATFIIEVRGEEGKLIDNASVGFDLNMTTMNMGTQQGSAVFQSKGRYVATGNLTMRGPWRIRTKVTMPDGSTKNKDFVVNVP